jgi:hypothetical protein
MLIFSRLFCDRFDPMDAAFFGSVVPCLTHYCLMLERLS